MIGLCFDIILCRTDYRYRAYYRYHVFLSVLYSSTRVLEYSNTTVGTEAAFAHIMMISLGRVHRWGPCRVGLAGLGRSDTRTADRRTASGVAP